MEAEKEEFGRWVDQSIAWGARIHELGAEEVRTFPVGKGSTREQPRLAMFGQSIQDRPELRRSSSWFRAPV
ncbi:MAG: hypothetical protein GEU90_18660 [Gemmatimonas sp.]|nr:hypothetical protein [Gemmatimonas sp.]